MLNTWKPRLICAALVSILAVIGCFDFGTAQQDCLKDKRCTPEECVVSDANDQPDDEFRDTNCDGFDGIADAGIFVDPAGGNDSDPGTADAPLKTLGKALELVRMGTAPPIVYLAQGPYREPGLVIDRPVALYGAYGGRSTGWERAANFMASLEGNTVGLVIRDIPGDAGVVIDRLTVTSANATDAGMPSIALQVIDSQDIRLRYSTFVAGQGAPGVSGNPGAQGTDGGVGEAGGPATFTPPNTVGPGSPGSGGNGACASGGAGSPGGFNGSSGTTGGTGGPSADGGVGGIGGDGGLMVDTAFGKDCVAETGRDGRAGTDGEPGPSGHKGEGMGMLSGDSWIATQQGGSGTAGFAGTGGGAGGSGGSCPFYTAQSIPGAAGGGSGGGGGAGCGGGGGGGGSGGGASIAVLLIRSNVQWEGTTTLRTSGGGRGGNGGEGGPGGMGGPGGPGGDGGFINDPNYRSRGGNGGAGGPGGRGGRGGHGGGGGGGPSVGVWCWDAGYVDMGTIDTQGLANGGPGGTTSTGGNPGLQGPKVSVQDCSQ